MPGINLDNDRARMRFLAREGRLPNYRDKDALEAIIREIEEKAVDWTDSAESLVAAVTTPKDVASALRCGNAPRTYPKESARLHLITTQAAYRKIHGWRRIGGRKATLRGECYYCNQEVVLIDNPWSEAPLYIQPVTIREWP